VDEHATGERSGGKPLQLVFPGLDHYKDQSDPKKAARKRRMHDLHVFGTTNSVVFLGSSAAT
jgi:hypothetical protein